MPDNTEFSGRKLEAEPEERGGDGELLRRYALEKSEAAFAELVERYLDLVYSAALRQVGGDTHRAKDVSQVVFSALAQKAAALGSHPVLVAWLYTAAQHAAAKAVRTEARRAAREQEVYLMQDPFASDGTVPEWAQVRPVLDGAMRELGERDREAVLLRFFARRPFVEIGRTLGLSEDAARMRVERALEKLRAVLARRGITSTGAALGLLLANEAVATAPAALAATVTGAALNSTAAAAVALTPLFSFMTTSKFIAGTVAATLLVAALGTAILEGNARDAALETLANTHADTAALATRLRALEENAAAAEASLQQARANFASVEAQRNASSPVAPSQPLDPVAAGREFLARHPEARALWDEYRRAMLASNQSPIVGRLNLSDAQREQLETILLRGSRSSTSFGSGGDNITLQKRPELSEAEVAAAVVELIGPERYARMRELERLMNGWGLVQQLVRQTYRTDPLNPEQIERLLRLLADKNAGADATGAALSPAQQAVFSRLRRANQP